MRKILIVLCVIVLSGCSFNKCPEGYKYNNNFCEKELNEVAKERIICDDGYELDGNKCTKKIQKLAEIVEYCPKGYDKEDGYCILVDKYDAKYKLYCPNGFLEGDSCYEHYYTDAYYSKQCPDDYPHRDFLKENACYQWYDVYRVDYGLTICRSGWEQITSKPGYCGKRKYSTLVGVYSCFSGKLKDEKCLNKRYISAANREYEPCKNGYNGEAVCLKTDVIDYKKDYKCESGYTLDGINCIKIEEKGTLSEQYCEGDLKPKDGMCIGVTRVPLKK